ncbi:MULTISPECIES: NAD-dependent epimerase/dehydratase family protein [Natrialbaceae]|uniref:NAD-dependent epimerase/dehydratase family protein n=1 Tax=Natrialbaceae TaxID=1644061 RepID=UPI00207D483F|nr:NAD(P)-dependent oxidoreductase [Natronococcus sp. CG52]
METVLVTGSLGRLGRWTADHLASADYNVIGVDRKHPGSDADIREDIQLRACDLTDQGSVWEIVKSVSPDAIVHLGAIPNPEVHSGTHVFENNVMSTYNVLVAAGESSVPVTWASSESAYGFPFAREPTLPDYLPVDEAHPLRPEDPYGSSKLVGEDIAEIVTRRYDIPVASLRISNVQYPGNYTVLDNRDSLEAGVGNFWSYVDGRDVAFAIERTLKTELSGHKSFVIAADDSYLERPTTAAFEEFFGELPEVVSISGNESALSSTKAQTVLGWEPQHSWKSAAHEDVQTPSMMR